MNDRSGLQIITTDSGKTPWAMSTEWLKTPEQHLQAILDKVKFINNADQDAVIQIETHVRSRDDHWATAGVDWNDEQIGAMQWFLPELVKLNPTNKLEFYVELKRMPDGSYIYELPFGPLGREYDALIAQVKPHRIVVSDSFREDRGMMFLRWRDHWRQQGIESGLEALGCKRVPGVRPSDNAKKDVLVPELVPISDGLMFSDLKQDVKWTTARDWTNTAAEYGHGQEWEDFRLRNIEVALVWVDTAFTQTTEAELIAERRRFGSNSYVTTRSVTGSKGLPLDVLARINGAVV